MVKAAVNVYRAQPFAHLAIARASAFAEDFDGSP